MSPKSHSGKKKKQVTFLPELQNATGACGFSLSNDYVFRAVFQTNKLALKGLISSLLHIRPRDIRSVKIINPVLLGNNCKDKEVRLDINVLLNDNTLINLEMQMVYRWDWHERTLVYICRNLDSLPRGENYEKLKPVVHIGILDKAPACEGKEFYSENVFMNVKTHKIYSDKVSLRVLRLDCVDNATTEDKDWKTDRWARLFRAATWEEIRMVAEHDKYLMTAADSMYLLNADAIARKRALDREDYIRDMQELKDYRNQVQDYENQFRNYENQLAEKDALIAKLQAQLAEKNA